MPICASDATTATSSTIHADCMTESLVQRLGTAANFGIWIGTLVVAPVSERCFKRHFKRLLLLLFAVQVILFAGLTLSLPLAGHTALLHGASGWRLLFLVGFASVCLGATSPLFIELGAEVTYPASEGISAGLVTAMINLAGLALLALLDAIPPDWLSAIVTLTVLLCAILIVRVEEVYLRTEYDEQHGQ
eukprot:SAG31_NODE_47_length_30979_cov_41.708841_22_plen_190_part_00